MQSAGVIKFSDHGRVTVRVHAFTQADDSMTRKYGTGRGLVIAKRFAMTANAFAEDKARCLKAGMEDFLIKPFTPSELYASFLRGLDKENA